jgi:hypothetical protein
MREEPGEADSIFEAESLRAMGGGEVTVRM